MHFSLEPTWEHAFSRFQCVTETVIHRLQIDFFAGRDLGRSIRDVDSAVASLIAAESLEADIVWNRSADQLLGAAIKERRNSDFMRAALAEICFLASEGEHPDKAAQSGQTWRTLAAREFPLPLPSDVLPLLQNTEVANPRKKCRRRHKKVGNLKACGPEARVTGFFERAEARKVNSLGGHHKKCVLAK